MELVKSETAKLARQKGFDESCLYIQEGSTIYQSIKPKRNSEDPTELTIPYQSQLQKWLREKHNIQIDIKSRLVGLHYINYIKEIYDVKNHRIIRDKSELYTNYELALENGLQEALKLL